MESVPAAILRAGFGLVGDRYADGKGTFAPRPFDRELTLIESEVLAEVELAPGESRRNLTTQGILLNALVGKRFRIGITHCEGIRLCEPCGHLERLTNRAGLVQQLVGRGGLRAKIIEGGLIELGDPLQLEEL
jgi:MOSC domain-containing protein YiiM